MKAHRTIKIGAIAGMLVADDTIAINLHAAGKRLLVDRGRPKSTMLPQARNAFG
jgi:hypothetical protein